jgi:hypothetical protein
VLFVWLFWLLLALPGLAVLVCFRPTNEDDGALGTAALAYLISFALLSPACIAGYWLELPLWCFSSYLAALVASGLGTLYVRRQTWWHPRRPSAGQASAALVLTLGLALGSAFPANMEGDTRFHLGRIRFLFENGLSNADPFTGTGFLHAYHTNILHSLFASGSRLTGADPLVFWSASLPWAKLAIVCGMYLLALRVSKSHTGAWIAALWKLSAIVLHDYILYPNFLAPGWLLPIGLGCAVAVLNTANTRYHLVLLCACSLVLAEVHGLYSGFLACSVAFACVPICLFRFVARPNARARTVGVLAATGFAVSLAIPFVYIARSTHRPAEANYAYYGGFPRAPVSKPNPFLHSMRIDSRGELSAPFENVFGGSENEVATVIAIVFLFWRRPEQGTMLFSAFAMSATVLMMPSLATPAAKFLGAGWMLQRMLSVIGDEQIALVAGGLPMLLGQIKSHRFITPALTVATLLWGLRPMGGFAMRELTESAAVVLEVPNNHFLRREFSGPLRADQKLLEKTIPRGSTVLVHPTLARDIGMLYGMSFIRISRGHSGVPDLAQRTRDIYKLVYAKNAAKPVQRELLQKYKIRYGITARTGRLHWRYGPQDILGQTDRLTVIRL